MTEPRKGIAYYLELEDDDFDLDEAVEFYRDMKIEIAPHEDLQKYLKKLETKIKEYIKANGQKPQVSGVQMQTIPKKDTEKADIVLLKSLAADVRREGYPGIADRILGCITEVPNRPAIKFIFEYLELK